MHAINRNTSIVNHKSINLSNSDSGCTCVHGLGASPEQASHAAPRQRLAAINITQWFNSFTALRLTSLSGSTVLPRTTKNDSSKGSEESHRGLTASRMGLRSEHESDDTRRGEWRSNGRAAAARGLLRILSNSRRAPRRTARKGARCWNFWASMGGASRGKRQGSGERAQQADGALCDGLWLGRAGKGGS
jgi:hypothetical protein